MDLKRSQARSYFAPLSRSVITRVWRLSCRLAKLRNPPPSDTVTRFAQVSQPAPDDWTHGERLRISGGEGGRTGQKILSSPPNLSPANRNRPSNRHGVGRVGRLGMRNAKRAEVGRKVA